MGQSGRWQSVYHDAMIDHDQNVGTVLDKLDELGMADNTIVMYGTDNGPHMNSWPDAAMTPFRNEKNSNWEGAYRVPAMVRWPGKIKAGAISNDIMSHLDWMPTLLAAAGDPDIKDKLKKGHTGRKQEIQGAPRRVQLSALSDRQGRKRVPGRNFFYFSDDGDLTALRYDNWKVVFAQQRAPGTMLVWGEPYVKTRIPWLFNLRTDPYERAIHHVEHLLGLVSGPCLPAGAGAGICRQVPGRHSRSFRRARRRPASPSIRSWSN